MLIPRAAGWENEAFKSALYSTLLGAVVFLIVDGINWLFSGKFEDPYLGRVLLVLVCGIYFTNAINSIHKRLDEISDTIKSQR
jgi:hypothetical protein